MLWIIFLSLIAAALALDLGVFNKRPHVVSTREALSWTTLWVSLSLLFSGVVWLAYRNQWMESNDGLRPGGAVLTYITGYLIELSLSMDNIFVIAVIFKYFGVPKIYQHRVLFWGILGAVVFRAIMIVLGVALINQFSWMTFVFGLLLLYSAYKMWFADNEAVDPRRNPVVRLVRRVLPVTKKFEGESFFVRRRHIIAATPLFITLMVIETTDVIFAIDSIPAILAITTDTFLVFSSNIFAILGLRSMYFVLASMLEKFRHLKYSLVIILGFVGVKMLLNQYIHLPEWISLAVILVSLTTGVIVSLTKKENTEASYP